MIDFKIDFTTNNLSIENGDFVLVKDADEVAQSLRIRLKMALGEWFLDNRIGTDYFGKIFKKGATDEDISTELRRVILETQGVKAILSYSQSRNTVTRKMTVSFTVSTIYDENISINENLNI
jgi:hypothetical protein